MRSFDLPPGPATATGGTPAPPSRLAHRTTAMGGRLEIHVAASGVRRLRGRARDAPGGGTGARLGRPADAARPDLAAHAAQRRPAGARRRRADARRRARMGARRRRPHRWRRRRVAPRRASARRGRGLGGAGRHRAAGPCGPPRRPPLGPRPGRDATGPAPSPARPAFASTSTGWPRAGWPTGALAPAALARRPRRCRRRHRCAGRAGERWEIGVGDPRDDEALLRDPDPARGAARERAPTASRRRARASTAGAPTSARHHLIDPRTGAPAPSDVVQATVARHRSAREAEAYAKSDRHPRRRRRARPRRTQRRPRRDRAPRQWADTRPAAHLEVPRMTYRGLDPRTTPRPMGAVRDRRRGSCSARRCPSPSTGCSGSRQVAPDRLPWVATRLIAFLSYFAIAGSVIYGLLLSTKILDAIAHRPVTFALHQDLAAIGLGLAGVHAVLLGPRRERRRSRSVRDARPVRLAVPAALGRRRPGRALPRGDRVRQLPRPTTDRPAHLADPPLRHVPGVRGHDRPRDPGGHRHAAPPGRGGATSSRARSSSS